MSEAGKHIAFSPPDITQAEIDAVTEALQSGWITTGPRTKELEAKLRDYTGAAGFACLNSATAALECALFLCGIGPGDEVIVPAYTYTASASCVVHVGATPVLVDVAPGSFHISPEAVAAALTPRTKAVIPVDIAGVMADYAALKTVLEGFTAWEAANDIQACFTRPIIIADAAHALGATRAGQKAGSVADFTAFSFHAVKNLTTAEGGGLAWREFGMDSDELYSRAMLYSLHGQTKDALHKDGAGNWEYDIAFPGYKCNMTDIAAALGLAQFERYPQLLARRRELVQRYEAGLAALPVQILPHFTDEYESSAHLMLVRIDGAEEAARNAVIERMGGAGISCNVHYKPLPLLSAYKNLGWAVEDFPAAFAQYENEITLPLHTLLSDDDVDYVCASLAAAIKECC
ncbi:MAG: DegT/DnrJ/EryC1/StrS family aminotransferase [Eggerthellaceae bacterium]|nr:DegT/DnrJ/EryC1/StrS family aminotransferase [Eggerthellaceae bacterium]